MKRTWFAHLKEASSSSSAFPGRRRPTRTSEGAVSVGNRRVDVVVVVAWWAGAGGNVKCNQVCYFWHCDDNSHDEDSVFLHAE